jgi:dephospho-CoA kinase
MTFVVGLTGGIGSGKSEVSARFAAHGADVIDTDEIARALTASGGAAMERVREAFGDRYVLADGSLDRHAMRALAFEDPLARARLEALLHPAIRDATDRALAASTADYAVLVVPLLFETGGYAGRANRTLAVDCDPSLQVERAARRPGLDAAQVRRIMDAQWPRWRRLQVADDVVWNGAGLAELEAQCRGLDSRYRAAARAVR